MNDTFVFNPIGIVRSCFTEKFGIPRQPRLAPAARATMEILSPYDQDEAFSGLDAFSHLWLVFVFHGIPEGRWRPTVRPPRLGGNRRTGVFATRSGFRPNPIGMSAVVLEGMRRHKGRLQLELSGIDLLDRTPVLDIKPYIPYADCRPEADGGFARERPKAVLRVRFAVRVRATLHAMPYPERRHLVRLLVQVIQLDPRPAYYGDQRPKQAFGMHLGDWNVRWRLDGVVATVIQLEPRPGRPISRDIA